MASVRVFEDFGSAHTSAILKAVASSAKGEDYRNSDNMLNLAVKEHIFNPMAVLDDFPFRGDVSRSFVARL